MIASRDATDAEKQIAQQRLAMLGQLQAADRQTLDRKTAGPLDQYRERLRRATGDMKEALQGVAVDGFESIESGLSGLISGTESVSSAFRKMASQIIADLARIAIEKAIVSAIGGSVFGLKTGGRIEGRAAGGRISGPGTGTSDSILALIDGRTPLMVSNGESIVTAQATSRYWPVIDAMNKGTFRMPGLATGGRVTPVAPPFVSRTPRLSSLAAGRAGAGRDVIYVQIDKSALFDSHVARVAAPMADAAAARGAAGGAQLAQDESSWSQSWVLR